MTSVSGLVFISPYCPPIPQKDLSTILRVAREVAQIATGGLKQLRIQLYGDLLSYRLRGAPAERTKVEGLVASIRGSNPTLAEQYANFSGWNLRVEAGGFSLERRQQNLVRATVAPEENPVQEPTRESARERSVEWTAEDCCLEDGPPILWQEPPPEAAAHPAAAYPREPAPPRAPPPPREQRRPPPLGSKPAEPSHLSRAFTHHLLSSRTAIDTIFSEIQSFEQAEEYFQNLKKWMVHSERAVDSDLMLSRLEHLRQLNPKETFEEWILRARPYALYLGWNIVPVTPQSQEDIPYKLIEVLNPFETYRRLKIPI